MQVPNQFSCTKTNLTRAKFIFIGDVYTWKDLSNEISFKSCLMGSTRLHNIETLKPVLKQREANLPLHLKFWDIAAAARKQLSIASLLSSAQLPQLPAVTWSGTRHQWKQRSISCHATETRQKSTMPGRHWSASDELSALIERATGHTAFVQVGELLWLWSHPRRRPKLTFCQGRGHWGASDMCN